MPLGDFWSVFLPYCLEKQTDGDYVVLNREYKPVGFYTDEHINYTDYPVKVSLKGLTTAKLKKLSWKEQKDPDRVFLYSDACVPTHSAQNMEAYLSKLEVLAKLKISDKN